MKRVRQTCVVLILLPLLIIATATLVWGRGEPRFVKKVRN